MTRSPAKWIKQVLFGKKLLKSHAVRKRKAQKAAGDDLCFNGKELSAQDGASPIIPHPLHVASSVSIDVETETKLPDFELNYAERGREKQDSEVTFGEERCQEEQAAVKIQALFRGYLARRAFHVLRGIIRLQAIIRGNLVRRQAAATLLCMCGIVKLQAMVRGQRVRLSATGIQVSKTKTKGVEHPGPLTATTLFQKKKLSSNKFVFRLISSIHIAKPLLMQYAEGEPNSVWIWLERWTSSHLRKPIVQPKKTIDLKSKAQHGGHGLQAKHSTRKLSSAKINTGSKITAAQLNRKKQSIQRVANVPARPVHGQQSKPVKVAKQNPMKMTKPAAQVDQADDKTRRSMLTAGRIPSSEIDVLVTEPDDSEKKAVDALLSPDHKMETLPVAQDSVASPYQSPPMYAKLSGYHEENIRKPHVDLHILHKTESKFLVKAILEPTLGTDLEVGSTSQFNASDGHSNLVELNPLHENPANQNLLLMNEHFQDILAAIRTEASVPDKSEHLENGLHSTLTLKSYMASTASAKAKLRRGSSKVSPGVVSKNGFTCRRSLSPSINGKLSQRVGQPNVKGGVKSDRAFSSFRDKNDKPIQAEWRR